MSILDSHKMICPKCGMVNETYYENCSGCGFSLEQSIFVELNLSIKHYGNGLVKINDDPDSYMMLTSYDTLPPLETDVDFTPEEKGELNKILETAISRTIKPE